VDATHGVEIEAGCGLGTFGSEIPDTHISDLCEAQVSEIKYVTAHDVSHQGDELAGIEVLARPPACAAIVNALFTVGIAGVGVPGLSVAADRDLAKLGEGVSWISANPKGVLPDHEVGACTVEQGAAPKAEHNLAPDPKAQDIEGA
jgi:hypothetical protein